MPRLRHFLTYSLATIPLWSQITGVGGLSNTTCASTELDWYTDVVGETPCVTYQRLRQICNNDYEVQKFRPNTPGDNCDDQVASCCCNSVSWALSMLCMNCQYDTQVGGNGIDAGVGAYQMYLSSCINHEVNQTLPTDIQTAVCNEDIKIDQDLYGLFWGNGDWYYIYTKETMTKNFAATNNNTFTRCKSTTINDTSTTSSTGSSTSSSTSAPIPTSTNNPPKSDSHVGPIVGGVVGGLGAIAIGLLGFFFWRRQRKSQGPTPIDLAGEYNYHHGYSDGGDPPMSAVTPFSATTAQVPSSRSGPESTSGSGTRSSKFPGGSYPGSPFSDEDAERHEDGGPVPHLQRSASGRLPPAYRSWEQEQEQAEVQDASQLGSDPVAASSTADSRAAAMGRLEPLRLQI